MAMDVEGNIYVADTFNDRIQKFDSAGRFLLKWGGPGIRDGEFNRPYGVAVDSLGNVYVVEYKGHRIQKFNNEGHFLLNWNCVSPAASGCAQIIGSTLPIIKTTAFKCFESWKTEHKLSNKWAGK